MSSSSSGGGATCSETQAECTDATPGNCVCLGCVNDGTCSSASDDCVCNDCDTDSFCANSANCTDDGDCNTLVEPAWLAVLSHDIGDGGAPDFTLSIRDNDDEIAAPNGADDSDEKVFIVARCTKYPDSPRVVEELIHYKPALNVLDCQAGGGTGAGTDIGNTDTCGGF